MRHRLSNFAMPALRAFEAVLVSLEIHHGLVHLVLRGEDKGSVLHDFLVEWEACYENCEAYQSVSNPV